MQSHLSCATVCRSVCVVGLTVACAGRPNASPPAVRTNTPVAAAPIPSTRGAGPGAAPADAVKAYIAEPITEVAFSRVRELTWPPELDDAALPATCLGRKKPLARTCRYPGAAMQRLSSVLLDAYQASHPDPERPSCKPASTAEQKAPPSPGTADLQRALDKDLAELEGCAEFPLGFVRALRAHEDPTCADALAQIPLELSVRQVDAAPARARLSSMAAPAEPQRIDDIWRDLLYGHALGAVFARWFQRPLLRLGSTDPAKIEEWRTHVLLPYLVKGQSQLKSAQRAVERLPDGSNGRIVAGHALWQAELRMVQNARRVQIPEKLKKDYETRTRFYTLLDQETQPATDARERHGASNCLLRAELGGLDDARLFSKESAILPQGEPRCSRFMEPPLPFPLAPRWDPRQSNDSILRLAATLPPAFVDALLSDEHRVDPRVHRALLTRGVPRSVRQFASTALANEHTDQRQNADLHLALARSEFRLGVWYFSAQSLERAKLELEFAPDTGETRLLRALTTTLLTAHREAIAEPSHGTCLGFDTSSLHDFLGRASAEPKELVALAGAALARLDLECLRNDFVKSAHTLLDRAQAGGAFYVWACWYDQMLDARPFFIRQQGDCSDPRQYRCSPIPWQGR